MRSCKRGDPRCCAFSTLTSTCSTAQANTYAFLEHEDRSFRSIAGDYSALPRRYLTDDYVNDSASCQIEGIVWYEFLSADPVREAQWAQQLGDASRLPQSMVVLVDFLDPALEERLEAYAGLPNVVAVREHLGWDAGRFHARRNGMAAGSEPDRLHAVATRFGGAKPLRERPHRDSGDRMPFRYGLAPRGSRALDTLGDRNVRPCALHVRQSHADRGPVGRVRASLRCLSGDRGEVLRGRTGRHVQGNGGRLVQAALTVHYHVDSREDDHPGQSSCSTSTSHT